MKLPKATVVRVRGSKATPYLRLEVLLSIQDFSFVVGLILQSRIKPTTKLKS
jgi:hypothetical protein